MKLSILHVEAGGSYGGSLRALELYLKYSDRSRFDHHLMMLRSAPGLERLSAYLSEPTIVLSAETKTGDGPGKALPDAAKTGSLGPLLSEAWDWARLAAGTFRSRKLSSLMQKNAYDLIHVNNTFPHQAQVLMAARFAGIPVIGHARNPIEDTRFNRTMMRWTAAVATVNREFEKELNAWKLATIARTFHDGIELRDPDADRVPALRAELLRGGTYLFGSVGRLDAQKGYSDIVEAARVIAHQDAGARFAVAGDGPQREMLQCLIRRHGLEDRFELCGFRADVPEFVSALDCFVSSSRWEGLPIAIVEAMLLRKPVVATAVGGNAELFPGREQELSACGNPAALAGQMLQQMRQSPRKEGLERSALIAAKLTDPARSAAMLDELFIELAPRLKKEVVAVAMNSA